MNITWKGGLIYSGDLHTTIELKAFSEPIFQDYVIFGLGVFYQTMEHMWGQFSAPFGTYTYFATSVSCITWLTDIVSGTLCGQPAESIAYNNWTKSSIRLF